MNFGEQIKNIRIDHNLTQEQMANKLCVTRQAVSNWENNRNLPDIEMIIQIAEGFHISLDQLILGGSSMNNMTEKLITDGSENRKAKFNLISTCIGTSLILLGTFCLLIKANSVEYIDAEGILHENFFLIPIAFLFLFCGFITFFITGMKNLIALFSKNRTTSHKNLIAYIVICFSVILICAACFCLLIYANSGM